MRNAEAQLSTEAPYISLADFAQSFDARTAEAPDWLFPPAAPPLPPDRLGLRFRLEDVLDTVVALQRAEWLQDGIFVGPRAMPDVHRDVLHCARVLGVAVPPAIAIVTVDVPLLRTEEQR